MDQYGGCLPGQCGDVTASIEGEAADWVVLLHNEGVLELGNVDTFMEELRNQFGDPSQAR